MGTVRRDGRDRIWDTGGASLDEVAAELKLSRERVRQIENIALDKCRAILQERGFSLEDMLPSSGTDELNGRL